MELTLFIETKNLIEKIKLQDQVFGQYLEKNIIFDEKRGEVIYLGKSRKEVPHLPFILLE